MDNLPIYNLSFCEDPALRTTAQNFEFKYCPKEQVERVIKEVQRNRLKKKKESVWSEFHSVSSSAELVHKAEVSSEYKNFEDLKKSSLSTVNLLSHEMESSKTKAKEDANQPIIREMDQDEIRRVFETALGETFVQKTSAKAHISSQPTNVKKSFSIEEILLEQGFCTPCREASPRWVSAKPSPAKEASLQAESNKHQEEPIAVPSFFDIHQSSPKASNLALDVDVENVSLQGNPSDERFIAEQILNLNVAGESPTQNSSKKAATAPSTEQLNHVPSSPQGPPLSSLEREELSKLLQINQEQEKIKEDASLVKKNSNYGEKISDKHGSDVSEDEARHIFPTVHIRSSSSASQHSKRSSVEETHRIEEKRNDICDDQPGPLEPNTNVNTIKTTPSTAKPPTPHENPILIPTPRKKTKARRTPRQATNSEEEELKAEKVAILSKITTYQNRIVRLLEKIKIDLYDVPEPEDHMNRVRREKRGNEFVTRFAGNNIYQIEILLEEIQLIPKEQYLSRNNNDFSIKVCNLYGTIYQAVAKYHKQMPNFIVDHNPRKLQILLNCIVETTKTCIHKRIFSKNDIIVENLLEKCKNLTTFIQDIALRVANAEVQKLRMSKKSETKLDVFKQNKLSMYNTTNMQGKPNKKKIVPVKTNRKLTSGRMERPSSTSVKGQASKAEKIRKQQSNKSETRIPNLENVKTQIETVENGESQVLLSGIELRQDTDKICKKVSSTDNLNSTVIEALQSATKQRVQEMLAPIMSNIGVLLNDQKATIDVQTLLNGLNTVTSQYANDAIFAANQALNQQNNINDKNANDKHENNNYLQKRKSNLECQSSTAQIPSTTSQQLTVPQSKHHIKPSLDTTTKTELNENFTTINERTNNEKIIDTSCIGVHRAAPLLNDSKPKKSTTSLSSGVAQTEGQLALNSQSENHQRNLSNVSTRGAVGDEGGSFGAIESSTSAKSNDMQKLLYQKNVQYTFIENKRSEDAYNNPTRDSRGKDETFVSPEGNIQAGSPEKKVPSKAAQAKESKHSIKSVSEALNERLEFLQNIFDNPLYVNEHFNEPWKVVSKIADEIISEAIINVEGKIDFGEENFIKDFIQSELER